ncbi:hypothetical protein A5886_000499 [Enterococcus sp. 8G7_MSG3316]|uniref:DUF624 domain-containing protein n=1 Tax=Candidatus Enterococcus testudinis TaxID=1834191 RepID=A0A242A3D2_9ENTE|nr:hypothetical protein [Enterococcus sp. 8G7_MSG3316]OTN75429.1 hypothetical protein A5886_000499 [Enterococcus sp. 8G7_MSG3316]
MFTKPTFDNNIYMKVFQILYTGLIANLCFWVAIFPLSVVALFLAINPGNIFWFAVSSLWLGSAMISLIAFIDQWIREKDIAPVKTYFRSMKSFGIKGFLYWLIGWSGTMIAIVDMRAFSYISNGHWTYPFFLVLAFLSIGLSTYSWYFQVRNPQAQVKAVLMMSFYYLVRKWYFSLINFVLFAVLVVLIFIKPQIGLLISPILLTGLIYLNLYQTGRPKSN